MTTLARLALDTLAVTAATITAAAIGSGTCVWWLETRHLPTIAGDE